MRLAQGTLLEQISRPNWISIIQYLAEKEDFGRIMTIVQKSKMIRLEDVLPYFPEFCNMDSFKV